MNTFPNRAVLRLSGPDTLSLLERTVTNTVANWQSGEMRYGALLTPQGKIIADFLAVLSSGDILLDVHEDAAADLEKRLKMFRLRADVTIERAEDLCVVTGDWADVRSAELPPRQIVSVDAAVGPLLPGAWHAARLNAGIPEWGSDYRAAEVFPTDINMDILGGIDYRKGCFVGQEVASRMKRKGTIRKRTLRVQGPGLTVGADITANTMIGTVTSCDGENGLALIRLDRLAAQALEGAETTCNDQPVRVISDPDDWVTHEIGAFYIDV
jgi:folate-binding protein YgfZ